MEDDPDAVRRLFLMRRFMMGKTFVPGQSGNPVGRPKGACSGRMKALGALDRILGKRKNLASLEKALTVEFNLDPVKFFKTIIMPLLPKDQKIEMDGQGVIRWQSLLGGGETDAADEARPIDVECKDVDWDP